ncbi:ATP-binding cassette domain-containing protein [Candidatus Bathyarchaeota archaeon]|nr:ATP-binding cassette domain-containing protein [Candidatus Bathyarchaeota archaeon]
MKHPSELFKIQAVKRRYDQKTGKYIINIAYTTAPPKPTERVLAVAEAFGLGIDQQQKFTVYDNMELKIEKGDIVYITGESGSGKSTLLKALEKDLRRHTSQTCINIKAIKPPPNKPIIETVGKNLQEAIELLSLVGLNDAFLFLRPYRQLSDGQKYRYKIAKLIESQAQVWILDEFASTLDRDTAKIVAYNLQKLARKTGKTVLAATTHTDLFEDLNPSVHIHKRYGKEITVQYYPNTPTLECSLTREMRIEEGTTVDYKALSIFHYRSAHLPPPRKIFTLKRGKETCGVIVYSYPPPTMFGRNRVWKGTLKQLQREVSTITRVIIHPKYRSIGLGTKIVKETLPLAGTPYVETLAVMAKYNPFFERAGMQKIAETKPNKHLQEAVEKLNALGFKLIMLQSQKNNIEKIMKIGKEKVIEILAELSEKGGISRKRIIAISKAYPNHEEFQEKLKKLDAKELAAALKRLAFLAQTKVYLFWKRNPNAKP